MGLMKPINFRQLGLCTLAAACAALTACAAGGQPVTIVAAAAAAPPPAAGKNAAPRLLQEIRAAIGTAPCDADAQCHSIGVGARPCGGPEGYLAWSSQHTDRERLFDLVERHREARRIEHESSGMLSDCRMLPDPGAACLPIGQAGQRSCQPADATRQGGRPRAP